MASNTQTVDPTRQALQGILATSSVPDDVRQSMSDQSARNAEILGRLTKAWGALTGTEAEPTTAPAESKTATTKTGSDPMADILKGTPEETMQNTMKVGYAQLLMQGILKGTDPQTIAEHAKQATTAINSLGAPTQDSGKIDVTATVPAASKTPTTEAPVSDPNAPFAQRAHEINNPQTLLGKLLSNIPVFGQLSKGVDLRNLAAEQEIATGSPVQQAAIGETKARTTQLKQEIAGQKPVQPGELLTAQNAAAQRELDTLKTDYQTKKAEVDAAEKQYHDLLQNPIGMAFDHKALGELSKSMKKGRKELSDLSDKLAGVHEKFSQKATPGAKSSEKPSRAEAIAMKEKGYTKWTTENGWEK